jgi:hypothetical protein
MVGADVMSVLRPRTTDRPEWTLAEDDMGSSARAQDEPDTSDITPVAAVEGRPIGPAAAGRLNIVSGLG